MKKNAFMGINALNKDGDDMNLFINLKENKELSKNERILADIS